MSRPNLSIKEIVERAYPSFKLGQSAFDYPDYSDVFTNKEKESFSLEQVDSVQFAWYLPRTTKLSAFVKAVENQYKTIMPPEPKKAIKVFLLGKNTSTVRTDVYPYSGSDYKHTNPSLIRVPPEFNIPKEVKQEYNTLAKQYVQEYNSDTKVNATQKLLSRIEQQHPIFFAFYHNQTSYFETSSDRYCQLPVSELSNCGYDIPEKVWDFCQKFGLDHEPVFGEEFFTKFSSLRSQDDESKAKKKSKLKP